jgi:phosphoribosyl-ATP pyrophosphohydrolase/phosphoribosyl-AMP cyclohydrolase/histidinol dehydrogenase
MSTMFGRRTIEELLTRQANDDEALHASAAAIVNDVRARGETALRENAERFDGLAKGAPLLLGRTEMERALRGLPEESVTRLGRIADRIRRFAEGQMRSLAPFDAPIPGGRAGHMIAPVRRVGCYAPGGRYRLPSSVLMTTQTARAAGVAEVLVASPRPDPLMLACAALADADGFLVAGGAHAVAALAYGAGELLPVDMIVGPGNAWVTAAKRVVVGQVGIDTLAGPSELVVVADDSADERLIAADLLAQAEHDPASIPILVSLDERVIERVEQELELQLSTLSTAATARAALLNGGALLVRHRHDAVAACDLLAPEHLQLHVGDPAWYAERLRHYGALFVGEASAEVLGDYGAGPNHVLPTGRASRFSGGLSVFSFLRVRTWLSIEDVEEARELYDDTTWLARVEGLEAHARSAELRMIRVAR